MRAWRLLLAAAAAACALAWVVPGFFAPEHLSNPDLSMGLAKPAEMPPFGADHRGRPLLEYALQGSSVVGIPALVAGADAVFTKPGYGILAEASLSATRLVWLDRGAWPEAPYLELAMWERGDIKVGPDGLASALKKAWSWPPPPPIADSATMSLARKVRRGW